VATGSQSALYDLDGPELQEVEPRTCWWLVPSGPPCRCGACRTQLAASDQRVVRLRPEPVRRRCVVCAKVGNLPYRTARRGQLAPLLVLADEPGLATRADNGSRLQ